MKTLRLPVLVASILLTVACSAPPCTVLRDAKSGIESGDKVVVALCACLTATPLAAQACQVTAIGYTITDATLNAAIGAFCSPLPAAVPSAKPQPSQIAAWLEANGAVRR